MLLATLAAVAVAFALPLGYLTLAPARAAATGEIHRNLARGLPAGAAGGSAAAGTGAVTRLGERLARGLTPGGLLPWIERQHTLAGRPESWSLPRVLVGQLALGLAAAALSMLYVAAAPSPPRLLGAVAVTAVAYLAPALLLHSRGQERQKAIQMELPDTLDQMTIAVEAGLGFDAAMARAGKNGKGPLAVELVRTLQDMRVGLSRREAFQELAGRTSVVDLRRFVQALIQADAYGVAIADVLRTQSKELRLKRRQRAEEKAMQVPVKVIFPLILCILPTLFIALLGPAVLDMVAVFGG